MPNRDKVIKGLEHCNKDGCAKDICADCPYVDKNPSECIGQLMSDALALLKEQEGVKPEGDNCYGCGYPVKRLRYVGPDKDLCVDLFGYCPMCGRKVKWDATD